MDNLLSIYQGIVVDNNDPEKLGRCKIKVPSIHGNISSKDYDLLPWALYISPNSTGDGRTTFILPKINDIVWVQFIAGSKLKPVYYGSNFAKVSGKSEVPVSDAEYFSTDVIYSSGDGAKIKKNNDSLRLEYGNASISISKEGNISINTGGIITINGSEVIVSKLATLQLLT